MKNVTVKQAGSLGGKATFRKRGMRGMLEVSLKGLAGQFKANLITEDTYNKAVEKVKAKIEALPDEI
jgi:hypothetical protein